MCALMTDMIPTWVDGHLTPVDKLTAHLRGLRHRAVSVFVLCKGEILIQRRAATKYHTPGLWANTCCTHPHWREDPRDCAVRRLSEELGLVGVDPVKVDQIEYRADVGSGMVEHEVVDLFVARSARRPEVSANPDEVQDTCWITLAELEARIAADPAAFTPWLKIYLQKHRASVFGPA